MKNITDLFFDLDDTLWDFRANSLKTFAFILEKNKIPVALCDFLKVYDPINREYWQLYRENKVSQEELSYKRFEKTFRNLNLSADSSKFRDDYAANLFNFGYLVSGVEDTLTYLNDKYQLHIISDGFLEIQKKKMQSSNIMRFFKTITCSDEVKATKPQARIYETALARAQTCKKNSVMIGDHLNFDVRGAMDFGLSAVYYNPSGNQNGNHTYIATISELKNIF